MPSFPGILPGRNVSFVDTDFQDLYKRTQRIDGARPPRGVFSEYGGVTPKYAKNKGAREADFRESLARLFIQIADQAAYTKFINSVPPESQALARVLAGVDGATGTSGVGGVGYVDFLLQNANHGLQEKVEVVETVSDNYVAYFFGQAAPTFQYSGALINSVQDDQAVNMYRLYRDILRGTQLARRKQVVRLRYDSFIVSGTFMNLSWQLTAENESVCPFSFQLLVKSLIVLPNDEYGLVVLNDQFAPAGVLPKLTEGVVNTRVQPVRLTAVPPERSSASASSKLNTNANGS